MNTEEIAKRLVSLCRKGQNTLAQVELYDDDIESIESLKSRLRKTKGIKKVQQKTAMFFEMTQKIHEYKISEPLIAGNFVTLKMYIDVTLRGVGRIKLEELCLYHTKNGKIIKEEFYYIPSF